MSANQYGGCGGVYGLIFIVCTSFFEVRRSQIFVSDSIPDPLSTINDLFLEPLTP